MKYKSKLLLLFTSILYSSCIAQEISNPNLTKRDSIILNAVIEYNKRLSHNPKVAISLVKINSDECNDYDMSIRVSMLTGYDEIKQFKLNYLYLGFEKSIFSNFPFILPVSQKTYETTLRKIYPEEYPKNKSKSFEAPMIIDGDELTLYFCKNTFLRKNWWYFNPESK
jgi:hypothetical protein